SRARPQPARLVKAELTWWEFQQPSAPAMVDLRILLQFYRVQAGLFQPFPIPLRWGTGTKMPSIRFNRNRVRLKRLLGIRPRLALLALILVAPLMLERTRSLESDRSKQIALASEEFAGLAKHRADTQ